MATEVPSLSALLIGIDRYTPPESEAEAESQAESRADSPLESQIAYGDLNGCVRDVERVAALLTGELGVAEERIRRLVAPLGGGEAPEDSPTAANIVAAWRQLRDAAKPGEQVWIHYSGHGGRVPTHCPELKGEGGFDEALVPTDIADPRASYLRDTEIATLLGEMLDADLLVTLVLDSCHSGGAARGSRAAGGACVGQPRARGMGQIDRTPRPTRDLVAPTAELARNWRRLAERRSRDMEVTSGWLPNPRGYVLLAACRAQEKAYEATWPSGEKGGALTHWCLETVRGWSPGYTWEELHGQVRSRVIGEIDGQTPQLEGDRERVVFGREQRSALATVDVMRVEGERLLLRTGQAQGVSRGARFAIYSPRAGRLATVEVREPASTSSWAEVVERFGEAPIEVGARAVLVEMASRSACRVFLPEGVGDAIRLALKEDGRGFVAGVTDRAEADFVVEAEEDAWGIHTADGSAIAGQEPRPRRDADGAALTARRLIHLAKFRHIRRIANHNTHSPLRGQLSLTLHRLGEDFDPSESPASQLRPLEMQAGVAEVTHGDQLCLEIVNRSRQTLNVVLLNLQPGWGIVQVYPPKALGAFLPFDPGQREFLPLRAGLSDGMKSGSDVLKAFATVDAAPYEWLELPPLVSAHRTPVASRSVELIDASGYDWTTAEVEIRVTRP